MFFPAYVVTLRYPAGGKSCSEDISTQYSSCGHKKCFYISQQNLTLATFSIFFYKRWLLLVNHSSQRKHSYPLLSFENRHADIDLPVKTSLSSQTILRASSYVPSWQANKILEMTTDCCFSKVDWRFFSSAHQQRVNCVYGWECQIMLPSLPNTSLMCKNISMKEQLVLLWSLTWFLRKSCILRSTLQSIYKVLTVVKLPSRERHALLWLMAHSLHMALLFVGGDSWVAGCVCHKNLKTQSCCQ